MSVIVCTHERPADLERCLSALAALEDPVEVIVVDSASKPPCEDLVAPFADAIPGLRYVYEPVVGLSLARNRGVALRHAARSSPSSTTTRHPMPDWARTLRASFDDPQVGCAGGTCRAAFSDARPRWLSDRLLQFSGITRLGSDARAAQTSAEYPFGANLAFRAAALREVGGFSTRLGRIGSSLLSGEESAVIEALRAQGWLVWLQPAAVVDHSVASERLAGRYYWRRLWWQGIGRARASGSPQVTLRLLVAAPVRAALWLATRDRFYLYRTAETVGYLYERWGRRSARA